MATANSVKPWSEALRLRRLAFARVCRKCKPHIRECKFPETSQSKTHQTPAALIATLLPALIAFPIFGFRANDEPIWPDGGWRSPARPRHPWLSAAGCVCHTNGIHAHMNNWSPQQFPWAGANVSVSTCWLLLCPVDISASGVNRRGAETLFGAVCPRHGRFTMFFAYWEFRSWWKSSFFTTQGGLIASFGHLFLLFTTWDTLPMIFPLKVSVQD